MSAQSDDSTRRGTITGRDRDGALVEAVSIGSSDVRRLRIAEVRKATARRALHLHDDLKFSVGVYGLSVIIEHHGNHEAATAEVVTRYLLQQHVLAIAVQIRDTAIEAGRMHVHKILDEQLPGEYFMSVKVHPHHFLRNNKTSGVAGADRLSTGMSHSFGVIEGRAALLPAKKEIFFVSCKDEKGARITRDAMESIRAKMPCATKIIFGPLK